MLAKLFCEDNLQDPDTTSAAGDLGDEIAIRQGSYVSTCKRRGGGQPVPRPQAPHHRSRASAAARFQPSTHAASVAAAAIPFVAGALHAWKRE